MASVPGRPISRPVDNVVLLPPFAADQAFPISQGFQGGQTHTTPDSEFAIDIVMPVGTEIHAARGGVVMDVEEDFNNGGTDRKKFVDKANHVRILHDDGTMALYAHLDLASVSVRPGARVRAGDRIARSGNTGFSSGPHLHFALQQNTGMKLISIPFRFRAPDGTLLEPEQQMLLHGAPANR
jgi:murein DD-endopeptidase MepM/ murein hydrolase activator NlpD